MPLEDAEGTEAGRVEEGVGLATRLRARTAVEVADRRPLPPDRAALLDQVVDAVGRGASRPGSVRGRRTGSWSTATSQVMSCVAERLERGPPRSWPR